MLLKYRILLALSLALGLLAASAWARTGDSGPEPGPFEVGCTNIELDQTLIDPGRSLDDYLAGARPPSGQIYLDAIAAYPADVFSFYLDAPDDSRLYGDQAGSRLPMVGLIMYPTSNDNSNPDYRFPGASRPLPHMQPPGGGPVFPDQQSAYPLLIFSHGYNSYPATDPQILAFTRLASHGYIVVALFHGDERFPPDAPFEGLSRLTLRALSVKSALDALETDPLFGHRIDWGRVGGLGVSYGGATMLAASGARLTNVSGFGLLTPVSDPRITAAAGVVSFCGLGVIPLFGLDFAGAAYLQTPQMIVCGDEDILAPCGLSRGALTASGRAGYLVTISGASHDIDTEALYDANIWTLTFLDAYIKDDDEAMTRLQTMQSVPGGPEDGVERFQ